MLYADDVSPILSVLQQTSNHPSCLESLLDIQVRRWLIEHVNVSSLHASHTNDKPLQLSSRQLTNFSFQD